ncbi:hypothetical protein PCASD_25442 [Puccinia coronata f. sp. avenae]|uniref:HAT C-terminal dimerisation domain-containing protein n=1 Tax=Puccinia coronata f. sp. avenae TaxID=200324 RepID=A0A2N5TNL0_9BASI|nr:hypothetical protein PCASD_25442 [Puccinia coronata f. sp. avenae]
MAQEMALIFNQESNKKMGIPNKWDPSAMHVRCACHKLALVVNASLKALSIITAPKRSVLGFFPVLDWTIEEDEEDKSPGSNTNKVNHKHCQKSWLGWLHPSLYRMRPSDSNSGAGPPSESLTNSNSVALGFGHRV